MSIIDNHIVIIIEAFTKDGDRFIKELEKDIKKLSLSKDEFERKRKRYLKSYILDFDNIEDVEYIIAISLMTENKISYKAYSEIMSLDYNIALEVLKSINTDNVSIIKTVK